MKILDTIWFTEMGSLRPIGIVIGEDEITGERKAYIGVGNGESEERDSKSIAGTGAKFHLETLRMIAMRLIGSNHDERRIARSEVGVPTIRDDS